MKHILKVFIILSLMLFLAPISTAYAETLEEQLNNLVGPKQQYNTMLSPVYLSNNTTEESISPQSGELQIAQTDYVLPGRNGLDLEFKRIYKSGISNVREMNVKYVDGAWVDYTYSNEKTTSFYEDRYNLGIGTRFSFPAIEIRENSDGSSHKFLHTQSGDIYRLGEPETVNNVRVYPVENQTIKDVEVREDSSFSNGQGDGTSKYMMVGKDGKKTYFADDGRILGIADRYGNTIKFEYSTLSYTINNYTKTRKLISKITDSIGRVVRIDYKEDQNFSVGNITNPQYSQEQSYLASQNPDNTYSGDLQGKFQIIITMPNNKTIVYDKSAVLVTGDTRKVVRTRLQRVYDMDGAVKYHFWYEQPDQGFTYSNGTTYSVFNRYENLTQINYCKTNRIKRYTYNTYTKKLSKGSMQYRKVFKKEELVKTGYDGSKANYQDRYLCDTYDKITYNYTNEPDGFGTSGYDDTDENYLKNTYRYFSEKTDLRGTKTKYTYDGMQELVNTEDSGNDHKEVTATLHDNMRLPRKTEKTMYNVVNGQVSGTPVKKVENFKYDEYGDLVNYTGPLTKRDADGNPVDSEYTVIYSYAVDKFHTPSLKTWKQDAGTTCQIIYTVDNLGNIIQEKRVHVDSGDKSIITDYVYDSYGNMTKKTVYSTDNNYVTNYEYGTDADGVDQKGAHLTREYTVVDGVEASKKYAYDFNTVNKKAEIDPNGNRTDYEYDVLSRVKKVTFQDSSTKQYSYSEYWNANMEIQYIDQESRKYSYVYDIQGNLKKYSVWNNNLWNAINRVEYDSNGNKIKETDANGHSIRYEYDSDNRLKKKSYWKDDSIQKESLTLDYTVGYDANTPLLVTLTDEDGYTKKFYYDIMNRLTRMEVTPDKTTYYSTSYTYDYTGNKTSITDGKNNTTKYIYDDLGRLVNQKDAALFETAYTYNSLDKVITKEEPGNKVTEYVYDSMGRTLAEKVYGKGLNELVYKKYAYDRAGNITRLQEGSIKDSLDSVSSDISYTYDKMNRVSDEYRKIDETGSEHISYQYDKNGNKACVTEYADKDGSKYIKNAYKYDFAGKVTEETGSIEETGGKKLSSYSKYYTRDYAGNLTYEKEYTGVDGSNNAVYNTVVYVYDYRNRVVQKTEPYGITAGTTKTTLYGYDKRGNLTSETVTRQGVQCTTTYQYDGMGNLVKKADPLGNTYRYAYDANRNRIAEIDPRFTGPADTAPRMEYGYDALNRPVKVIAADQNSKTVISYKEYDGRGNIIKQCDGEGYNSANPQQSIGTLFNYDASDNVVKQISAAAAKYNLDNGQNKYSKKFTYDGSGRVLSEEDANGNITYSTYYLNGQLKEKIFPDTIKESYEYDLTGKITSIKTGRDGNTTTQYNNIFGKPYRIEYPDRTYEAFEYNFTGQVAVSYDRKGQKKENEYDSAKNLIAERTYIKDDGSYQYYKLVKYGYDEGNNLLYSETFLSKKLSGSGETPVSAGDATTFAYDSAGRLVKVSGPNGRETLNEYDASGKLITKKEKVSDGYYNIKRYKYDLLSRLTSETLLVDSSALDSSALPGAVYDQEYQTRVMSTVKYTYYKNGEVKSKTDANNNDTLYEYDYDNRLTKTTDPMKNSTTYIYDLAGNLIEQKNAKKIPSYFEYDTMNRLIRKKTPAADGGTAVTRYIYDAMGNKLKEITPNNYDAGRDTPELAGTMPGISYTYDKMNRLVSALSLEGTVMEYRKYDSNGNVVKVVDGLRYNGDVDKSPGKTYLYDGLNRAVQITDAASNNTYYEYDVLGNLTKQTDALGNPTEYEYNPDKTLAKVKYADGGYTEYSYDKLGQILTSEDQLDNVTTYTYNAFGKQKGTKDPYECTTENKYDLAGNLVVSKDKKESRTYYSYDGNGRLTEKKVPIELDAGGDVVYSIEKYAYDELGNITVKTLTGTKDESSKHETSYTYYDNNLVKSISDNSGSYTGKYYDKNGNLIKEEILRDTGIYDTVKYEYDRLDRMTAKIQLVDEEDIYNASGIDNIDNLRDAGYPGKIRLITSYEYDLLGNKIKVVEPGAYRYAESDTAGRDSFTMAYSYDVLNRVEKVTRKYNGSDIYTQYFYDKAGNKVKERNERGCFTQYAYDKMNRLKTVTDALNKTMTYGYDLAGNKISQTNAKDDTITYTYDKLNRPEKVIDPYDIVISKKIYDKNGNVIKEIDAKGYLSGSSDDERYGKLFTYDLAGRLVKVVDPEIAALNDPSKYTVKYEYNQFGEKVREIDALGNATRFEYDNAGRLTKVTDALVIATKYFYDKMGNKTYMSDGRSKTTSYTYGSFGILLLYADADNGSISYKYDLSLNKASTVDKNKNETLYAYDSRKLMLSRSVEKTGDRVEYTYDEVGNRVSMADESGTSTYAYDDLNRLTTVSKDGAKQVSYTYDEIGNITTVTDKTDFVTSYTYDRSSRMKTAGYAGKTATYSYDKNGNREAVEYDGGVKEEYTYDKNNKLLTLKNKKPDGSVISSYTYTYDLAGRQATKTDSYGTTAYTYDKTGRITKVQAPGKTTVYAYDKSGNRASLIETYTSEQISDYVDDKDTNGIKYIVKKSEYVYSNSNRLLKLVEKMYDASNKELLQKTTAYLYDGNGNEIKQTVSYISAYSAGILPTFRLAAFGDSVQDPVDKLVEVVTNEFDGFNRLKKTENVKSGKRVTTGYVYDGDDLRVRKTVKKQENNYAEEITNYLYDRQHVILETDGADRLKTRYVRGINYIAKIDGSNKLSYYLYNGHGDVVQTVSENGTLENQYDYDIFGNPTLTVEHYGNAIRYAGEFYDAETGLYYLRARYYDPATSRMLTEDSYPGDIRDPLSLNLYTYCGNDPINRIDPSGNNWTDAVAGWAKSVDDSIFFGAAGWLGNKIRSVFGADENDWNYQKSNNPDFALAYQAGTYTNLIYGVVNLGSGLYKITTSGGEALVTSSGQIVEVTSGSAEGIIQSAKGAGISFMASRGIGGKGWQGDKTWKSNLNQVGEGGTIEKVNDVIPTQEEAIKLINESKGKVIRIEGPHPEGGVSPHTYPHINYETANGVKGTIRIQGVIE